MTNTGDFRRYSYQNDAAYALKAFDVQRSSAAPAYTPRKKDLKVRENTKRKSDVQLEAEQRAARAKVVAIFSVALLAIGMLFGMVHTFATKNELSHEITDLENQYAILQSENTRINSELNSLVSMNMIEKYAVENLNMSKARSNQIRYIDVSQYKEKRQQAMLKAKEQNVKK